MNDPKICYHNKNREKSKREFGERVKPSHWLYDSDSDYAFYLQVSRVIYRCRVESAKTWVYSLCIFLI